MHNPSTASNSIINRLYEVLSHHNLLGDGGVGVAGAEDIRSVGEVEVDCLKIGVACDEGTGGVVDLKG